VYSAGEARRAQVRDAFAARRDRIMAIEGSMEVSSAMATYAKSQPLPGTAFTAAAAKRPSSSSSSSSEFIVIEKMLRLSWLSAGAS